MTTFSRKIVPFSDNEKSLLDMIQNFPDNPSFWMKRNFFYDGAIDKDILEISYNMLLRLNDNLRATYHKPYEVEKVIHKKKYCKIIKFICHDYSDFLKQVNKLSLKNNKISSFPLLKVYLCYYNLEKTALIVHVSHLVADGWSAGILIKELEKTYNIIYAANKRLKIFSHLNNKLKMKLYYFIIKLIFYPLLKGQWSCEKLVSIERSLKKSIFYTKMKKQIIKNEDINSSNKFSVNYSNTLVSKDKSTSYEFKIEYKLIQMLLFFCEKNKIASLSTVLLANYCLTLYFMENINNLRISMLSKNRHAKQTKYLVGYIAHEILLIVNINLNSSFLNLINKIKNDLHLLRSNKFDQVAIGKFLFDKKLLPNVEFNYLPVLLELSFPDVTSIPITESELISKTDKTWYGESYQIDLSIFFTYIKSKHYLSGQIVTRDEKIPPDFSYSFHKKFIKNLNHAIKNYETPLREWGSSSLFH